jgi:hypothetical protein
MLHSLGVRSCLIGLCDTYSSSYACMIWLMIRLVLVVRADFIFDLLIRWLAQQRLNCSNHEVEQAHPMIVSP